MCADLSNSQMAETSDQFCLIEGSCSLLHFSHERHLLEPLKQVFLRHADVEAGCLCAIATERVFIESDGEWMAGLVRRRRGKFCAVGRGLHGLNRASSQRLRKQW